MASQTRSAHRPVGAGETVGPNLTLAALLLPPPHAFRLPVTAARRKRRVLFRNGDPDADHALADCAAIITDMRGYPRGTFYEIGQRLATERVIAARFQRAEWHSPNPDWNLVLQGRQILEPETAKPYRGKVVVLIDERAISQAEHTCLFIEAATDATFIGSPTNGANGDVTQTILPGGVLVAFTGQDVRHGDGRQLQRVGIQPDVHVESTIEGIRQGRDEVLEAAIAYVS